MKLCWCKLQGAYLSLYLRKSQQGHSCSAHWSHGVRGCGAVPIKPVLQLHQHSQRLLGTLHS